jgi:uncharacterized protein (UPF0264 family)
VLYIIKLDEINIEEKMSYTIQYDMKNKYVNVSIEGEFNLEQAREFAEKIVQEIKRHDCNKILNDVRNIDLRLSTLDIYSLPKIAIEAGLDRFCRRALIASSEFNDIAFFETVSQNQAHNVKIFRSREDALEWLLSD